jgi:hypothetical protein
MRGRRENKLKKVKLLRNDKLFRFEWWSINSHHACIRIGWLDYTNKGDLGDKSAVSYAMETFNYERVEILEVDMLHYCFGLNLN